jgi:hypothetical protein
MTVTITPTGNNAYQCLQALVFTGAHASNPIGISGKTGTTTIAATATYTSTVAGSWGWLVWDDYFTTAGPETVLGGVTEQSRTYVDGYVQMFVQKMTTTTTAADTSVTIGASAPTESGRWIYFEIIPEPITRQSAVVSHVGSTAWNAPASSTTVTPTIPGSLQTDDVVYAELHIKPDTATVATPANWTFVTSAAGGTGTQGADAGASRVHLYKQVVPGGGLSGSQAFTVTSGSSLIGCMRAFRTTGVNIAWDEAFTSYSRITANTTFGGTGLAAIGIEANDAVVAVVGSPSDADTTVTISALTTTGVTYGSLTQSPAGTAINAQGNDSSASAAYVLATAGSASAAPVVTATSNASHTGVGFVYRVQATVDVPRSRGIRIVQQAIIRASYH